MTTRLHVIGMGLNGWVDLPASQQQCIAQASLIVGSDRLLNTLPDLGIPTLSLQPRSAQLAALHTQVKTWQNPAQYGVFLASGDPLFYGIGRLLLDTFPADWLEFHPQVSSVQLAFSRLKLPWQEAKWISIHGRSWEPLMPLLKAGESPLAILTDPHHSPQAIAELIYSLDLPTVYELWIGENLGGEAERIERRSPRSLHEQPTEYASLTVVVLCRRTSTHLARPAIDLDILPKLGLPDASFISFPDRPGLMTKRELRVLALSELALADDLVVWDIGAGTGSLAIEVARLSPSTTVFAIEKTAIGQGLIQQNCERFQTPNVHPIAGIAPDCLADLPRPDRIFIGGSGGQLIPILETSTQALAPQGMIVMAIATLEHFALVSQWIQQQKQLQSSREMGVWRDRYLQAQLSRSVTVAHLNRWQPLNPITLVILTKQR